MDRLQHKRSDSTFASVPHARAPLAYHWGVAWCKGNYLISTPTAGRSRLAEPIICKLPASCNIHVAAPLLSVFVCVVDNGMSEVHGALFSRV